MSQSSWPPQLKTWVQDCLAKATSANKAAVNAELKQILFQAHKDGTVGSTDWSKVELKSLKAQASRTHVTSPPKLFAPPTQSITTTYASTVAPPSYTPTHTTAPTVTKASKKKDKKRKIENGSSGSSFPTPYVFESAQEADAKARRAARFQREAQEAARAKQQNSSLGHWFNPDEDDGSAGEDLSNRIAGMKPLSPTLGRKKLKGKGGLGYASPAVIELDPSVMNWDAHTIRGTNTRLEKSYLRLTSEPDPADIRPLPVLKQTLELLKRKWKESHNYAYAVDQFKSVRQDLTVQRIKNEFTVEVYEIHARIALEAKDLGEYNQCQSMLRQLYELGISGHPKEFLAYRILYLLHTRNRSDMAALLSQLTPEEKADHDVLHALDVAAALATSNYTKFFRLWLVTPNMGAYIIDHFIERERAQALAVMSKAYLSLPLPYITSTLAFENDEQTDAFLQEHQLAVYSNVQEPPVAKRDPANPWKSITRTPVTPLDKRLWACKQVHLTAVKAVDKYRVVDLKGQVD